MIDPFVPNGPFLYPLKTSEKPYGFLMFSGGRERVYWERMGEYAYVCVLYIIRARSKINTPGSFFLAVK